VLYLGKVAILTIMTMAGACSFWQFYAPDVVPPVIVQSSMPAELVHRNTTQDVYLNFNNYNEDQRWESLQPTLLLLRSVCPEAEEWARQKHAEGMVFYSKKGTGYYAAYSAFFKYLVLNEAMFEVSDGCKASILAHEFRHSRQSLSKFILAGLWLMVSGRLPIEYYEDEAEGYQQKVWCALLGVERMDSDE
jgi:hypothetical protein